MTWNTSQDGVLPSAGRAGQHVAINEFNCVVRPDKDKRGGAPRYVMFDISVSPALMVESGFFDREAVGLEYMGPVSNGEHVFRLFRDAKMGRTLCRPTKESVRYRVRFRIRSRLALDFLGHTCSGFTVESNGQIGFVLSP